MRQGSRLSKPGAGGNGPCKGRPRRAHLVAPAIEADGRCPVERGVVRLARAEALAVKARRAALGCDEKAVLVQERLDESERRVAKGARLHPGEIRAARKAVRAL